MQRLKDEGLDASKPCFSTTSMSKKSFEPIEKPEVSMKKESISREITIEELQAHNKPEEPWFSVQGEVMIVFTD